MEFGVIISQPEKQKTSCLVVAVFKTNQLSAAAQAIDIVSNGKIGRIVKKGDLDGSPNQSLLIHDLDGIEAERVLLIGCGESAKFDAGQYKKAVLQAVSSLKDYKIAEATLYLADESVTGRDTHWNLKIGSQLVEEGLFKSGALKTIKDDTNGKLVKVTWGLIHSDFDEASLKTSVDRGHAIGLGVNYARDLGNLPGNVCTPTYLAEQALDLAKKSPALSTEVLDEDEMEQLGMGALLSVSRGSRQPAKLIVMKYQGGPKDQKPIALVGKGLTFDAGGVSLKPSENMDEMKFDMCGAASVFGTMKALTLMKPAINVLGIVPASENLPDGAANKPGDIVTSMSGQSIEILNTDAEGRLILCDALTYTERFDPAVVIDIATLTGACVIALGKPASGLFTADDELADEILGAGNRSYDRAWRMPLWEDYQEQLKSNFADMQNIGGREAGSITAACFLSRYTKNYRWAHLDIAGTAWLSGVQKGATGRPVPLLSQFILDRCQE